MKLLFTAGGSHATVFSVAPLATAARNEGHEILLTADEPLMETAVSVGLPAVPTPHPGQTSARLRALLRLAEDWPPDLIVGGLSFAPGLVAARLGIPYVRQVWDIRPTRPEPALEPELKRLGLAAPPDPALLIDVCPPCLRPPYVPGAQPMRWIPRNRQRRIEPWMYTRPEGRPRVLVTSGTRSLVLRGTPGGSLRRLVDELAALGAEVLIAAPDRAAEEFGAELGGVRIGWIPMDVVAPTCDLVVHHGGAATTMTVMNAAVPQLIVPESGYTQAIAQAVAGFGAGLAVSPQEADPGRDPAEVIAAGCREILADPEYAQRARALAKELTALPSPAEVVRTLEALAAA